MLLSRVTPKDYQFLYELLKEKKPEQNISHIKVPHWGEHVEFNNAQPYKDNWVIMDGEKRVGRIYVTNQNEVGIAIKEDCQGKNYGGEALDEVIKMNKDLLANISPSNLVSQHFFEKRGFKLIQYTYKYDSNHSCKGRQ